MPRELRRPLAGDVPATALTNSRIAAVLTEIADLLEIKGESSYKVGAYRRAADSVARAGVDVAEAYRAGDPPRLRGVGGSIGERLEELASTGRLAYHEALRAEVPPTLLELLAIPGVGPRTAGEVWRTLGIATLGELERAADEGVLRQVNGLSARTEARIIEGIAELEQRPPRRMRMGEAHRLARRAVALIEELPGVVSAVAAGSVRRWRETVGDLDILVESNEGEAVLEAARVLPFVDRVETDVRGGADRSTVRLADGPQLDIMVMPPGATGSYLVHFTGSAEHNVALRHRARERGWSLSERGLVPLDDGSAQPRTCATEAELYALLDLPEIPPELREGRGEIEAAEADALPRLIERADLRGDCHSHSHWSDGREPLEVMVESARAAGRAYQVLTDHSHSLGVANGLTPARVEAQRRVIGELNERFAREAATGEVPEGADPGFRLLHGTELEITVDGRLDYGDELLATLDVVVASLHVGRRQPRERLMARYAVAMRNPHVDIISHPSGRKIGVRPDLDLDWEVFYRLAAETGTLLEINGSEARLDLDEHRIRAAAEAGCRFVIASDAHERADWAHLDWGIGIARRGWLTEDLVANTLPRDDFSALMREKPHHWEAR
ncbi:MAG: helix-hairpin-helix domain-containing protein [Candidatus Limnocylindrales bacterium]